MEDLFDDEGKLQEPDHSTISVNLISAMNTVKLAIWYMQRGNGSGSIVVTGSIASYATQDFVCP